MNSQSLRLMLGLFFLSFTSVLWAQDAATITVTKALWGGADVTQAAKDYCDGGETCQYKVDEAYIGAPLNPLKKSFSIKWTCAGSPKIFSHLVPHDATDEVFDMDCPAPPPKPVASAHPRAVFPASMAPRWLPQRYKYAFRSLALATTPNAFNSGIENACNKALKVFIKAGRKFTSSLIKANLSARSTYPFLGDGETFYHYTNATDVKTMGLANRPLDFFDYIRTTTPGNSWGAVMYVADDSDSSKSYGDIQLRVHLRKVTNVLSESDFEESGGEGSLGQLVSLDLVKRYPALKTCTTYKDDEGSDVEDWTSLYFLAAEEMGVDLIHYKWSIGEGHWFQIINPYAIDHFEVDP